MKFKRDGSEQIQIGGRKPPYTLYVRAIDDNARAILVHVRQLEAIRDRHQAQADALSAEIEGCERQLDALITVAQETNDEMHAVVVRQEPGFLAVLRQFVWREPSVADLRQAAKGIAAGGATPTAA